MEDDSYDNYGESSSSRVPINNNLRSIENENDIEFELEPDKAKSDKKQTKQDGKYRITKYLYVDEIFYSILPMEYPITSEKGVAIIFNVDYVKSQEDAEKFTDNKEEVVDCYFFNTKVKKLAFECQSIKACEFFQDINKGHCNVDIDTDFEYMDKTQAEIENSNYSKNNQELMKELLDASTERRKLISKQLKFSNENDIENWADYYTSNWVIALLNPEKSEIDKEIWNLSPDANLKRKSKQMNIENSVSILQVMQEDNIPTHTNDESEQINDEILFSPQETYIQLQEENTQIQEKSDFKKRKVENQVDNSENMDMDIDEANKLEIKLIEEQIALLDIESQKKKLEIEKLRIETSNLKRRRNM
ncbi:19894_t:CDS:2 [Racocetra fulgida]|uniref:19894_t:CDS:1 n=1 Tax=Racocetra fulgida TaxID=60492 RepID=A0A9N9BJB1_9GLOM|nr:19894_t:CDS:2 [Racocetra fulgida]